MKIVRKFNDVKIEFKITDEEVIEYISEKKVDERITFFRALFEKDFMNVFPFSIMKKFLKNK